MSDDQYKDDLNVNEEEQGSMEEFPKEIVQLLMKNHPIKNNNTADALSRTGSLDREQIKAQRKQRLEEARAEYENLEEELTKNFEQTGQLSLDGVEDMAAEPEEIPDKKAPSFDTTTLFDDDEDLVQLVRRTSRSSRKNTYRKGFNPGDVEQIEEIEKVLEESKEERPPMQKSTRRRQKRDDYEEMNEEFYKIEKPEDTTRVLDVFFDENEEYEDDEKFISGKLVFGGICAVAVILIAFLGFKTITLSGQYKEAMQRSDGYEELQEKNEELKLTILSLQEELEKGTTGGLPVDSVGEGEEPAGGGITTSAELNGDDPAPAETTPDTPPANTGDYTEYTVQDGDSYWTIAEKLLGNGVEFQKILDANGLSENDSIRAGQVLKIPN